MDLKSLYLLNTCVVICRAVGLCGFRNSLLVKVKHCMVSYISIFIAGGREYPAVRVEYKMASERYLVAEIACYVPSHY